MLDTSYSFSLSGLLPRTSLTSIVIVTINTTNPNPHPSIHNLPCSQIFRFFLCNNQNKSDSGGRDHLSISANICFYRSFVCATYSYAAGGYFSSQIYSDSSCTSMVAINEVNLNQQCFWSADNSANYVSNVAQYYASDTTTTGINSYTLANSYSSSSTCSTATTTLLSSAVSLVSYTSSCTCLVIHTCLTGGY